MRTALLLLLTVHAQVVPGAGDPPPAPPLPWHVDAYIGFERNPDMDTPRSKQRWYWQNSLQIDGDKLKLHKQAVVCEAGKLFSSEGGGALFYEGSLQRTKGRAKLRYSRCDRCLANLMKPSSLNLTIEVMAPDVIQMGGVKYSKAAKPYPEHCPPLD